MPTTLPIEYHVLNLGAGVQSTTLYLMFMQGELGVRLDYAIFADTGEEPKAVYEHLDWLNSLNGPPILRRSIGRLGEDLKRGRNTTGQCFATIPAYTQNLDGEEGRTQRQCSKEYKVEVIKRSIRRDVVGLAPRKRIPKSVTVTQYVGISLDEAGRFERLIRRREKSKFRAPLIERHMTRKDCKDWLAERGQVPHEVPRSACVFCPFHSDAEWMRVKEVPEDWARAVEIDEALRVEGNVIGRGLQAELYLHRQCKPLVQIEFRPQPSNDRQQTLGFWRECLGVCGV